jgi:flagellum-specific peptidoglycan hydrolase FlgJ
MPANNYFGMKSTGRNRARGAGSANLETTEGAGGDAKRVRQDFATFDSADDASTDMLSLLERKYPRALEALQAGDEAAYVAALKDGGYFTGDEAAYLRSIQRML